MAATLPPGLSVRHGPVNGDTSDLDCMPNGISKRKSRSSIDNQINYKDESESDEGAPLVSSHALSIRHRFCTE